MSSPRRRRWRPSAPDDDRQHHVVDRAAELVLDRLDVAEARAHPGEAPVRADRARCTATGGAGFEPRPRHRADADERSRAAARRPGAGRAQRRAHAAHDLGRHRGALEQRLAEQLRAGRRRARAASAARARGGVSGSARGVEQHGRDVDAGDAVHQRVVGLATSTAKRSPSRPSTSQISHSGLSRSSRCENTRPGECRSCSSLPGRGQRGVADVVAEVEVRVVDPHRPALAERHERELLPVARHQVQAAARCASTKLVVARAARPRRSSTPQRACAPTSSSRCRNDVSRPVSRSPWATRRFFAGADTRKAEADIAPLRASSTLRRSSLRPWLEPAARITRRPWRAPGDRPGSTPTRTPAPTTPTGSRLHGRGAARLPRRRRPARGSCSRCTSRMATRPRTTACWPRRRPRAGGWCRSAASIPTPTRWPRRDAVSMPARAGSSCTRGPRASACRTRRSSALFALADERNAARARPRRPRHPGARRGHRRPRAHAPGARLILAHAGICDLAWIWRQAAEPPNLYFDTPWWSIADLLALFALVPPGQILFASDAPYGSRSSRDPVRCAARCRPG